MPKIRRRGYLARPYDDGSPAPVPEVRLYVFECAGVCKVGIASDPKARMLAMRHQCPLPVTFIASRPIRADVAGWAEYLSHLALADCHTHGEWFNCDPARATKVIEAACFRANSIPLMWMMQGNAPEEWVGRPASRPSTLLRLADEALANKLNPERRIIDLSPVLCSTLD